MQTLVILGATSAVAIAYARKVAIEKTTRFVLVGRNETRLEEIRTDIVARGGDESSFCLIGDLGQPAAVASLFAQITDKTEYVDQVLLAYGLLGDQKEQQKDIASVQSMFEVNLVSATMWVEAFAQKFEEQTKGHLVIIGSVAGDRGRQSNYLYGATKGALERVAEGMAHRFAPDSEINVTLVKPGFIDTPMTDHIDNKGGPLWATPEKIADVMMRAVEKKRVRVYAPWIWRWILLIVRSLPMPIMHKTKM